MGWADDPELLATFQGEVAERLESLRAGLLEAPESTEPPRALVDRLFRDAHTIKGSARMLGLDAVVELAHRAEDVLGAVRDGRISLGPELVDLLLAAADGIEQRLPGSSPVGDADSLLAALEAARDGRTPVSPEPTAPVEERRQAAPAVSGQHGTAEVVRVPAARLHLLVDSVGEAEQRARHLIAATAALAGDISACRVDAGKGFTVEEAMERLELLDRAAAALRLEAQDAAERLELVRGGAMALAMVPLRRVSTGFAPLVRQVAQRAGKEVDLVVDGADVELDAQVLDGIAAALRHLLTNAIDHGCESPTVRTAAGKPARATVSVRARAAGATVVVEVADDGAGIDAAAILGPSGGDLLDTLCRPDFTTRATVTQTSGRGVGLDAVRTAVEELGGSLSLETTIGAGSVFTMTLPVTLGVMRCLIAEVGGQRYAIPVANVVESIDLESAVAHEVAGRRCLATRGELIPVSGLAVALGLPSGPERTAVVIRRGGERGLHAWSVDEVLEERELVVKDLGPFLGRRRLHPGACIDEGGRVVLLLDPREVAPLDRPATVSSAESESDPSRSAPAEPVGDGGHVLIVEDSHGVRELQRRILEGAGYTVSLAVDGQDGAARLTGPPVDLVVSDVEMPGMDGFNLTRTIRRTPGWEQVPVVIMTSRGEDADKRAGLEAGADAYLLKATFDSAELISTVRRLIGR